MIQIHRFGEIAIGMQVVTGPHVALGLGGRQHNDRDASQRRVLFDLGEHLAAVLARKVQIKQHKVRNRGVLVGSLTTQHRHRLLTITGDSQLKIQRSFSQNFLRQPNIGRIVLYQEDVRLGHRCPCNFVSDSDRTDYLNAR